MLQILFQTFDHGTTRLAEKETATCGRLRVALLVGALATLGSAFWYFNPTDILYSPPARLDDFARQCADPLTRDLAEPILAYRVVAPAIAWLCGLRGLSGLIVQHLALIGCLAAVYAAVRRVRGIAVGVLAAAAVSSTFAAIWVLNYPGFPDSVTHFFVALALLPFRPAVLAFCLTLATLNDERAMLAFPLVALWHWTLGPRDLRRLVLLMGMLATAGAVYILLRHALTAGWIGPGIARPAVYAQMKSFGERFSPFNSTWPVFLWNVFCGFRWLWVLPFIAVACAGRTLPRHLAWLLLAYVVLASLPALIVEDVSRTIGFLFPALLLALLFITDTPVPFRRGLAVALIALQILTPIVYRVGQGGRNARPFPLEFVRIVTGYDPADLILHRSP